MVPSATPRVRVGSACAELGRDEVVRRCGVLLSGGAEDPAFIEMLGGAAAPHLLGAGVPAPQAYWIRVWAARGLLWAGPGKDLAPLKAAVTDESWRVREMACKVIARYVLGELLEDVSALEHDPIPRVRDAAGRAVRRIIGAGS